MDAIKLLKRPEVEARVGLTTSTIYREMRAGRFPLPRRVGQRAVRWRADEIAAWVDSRVQATGDGIARNPSGGRASKAG